VKPGVPSAPPAVEPAGPPPNLDDVQRRVWDALDSPKHADDLARDLAVAAGDLSTVLMKMELKKAIRRLPGNTFERR
jgi:predicted Rossmann fold nucleotide-binding protein DprA/Smf involved in DNA uptake